LKGELITRGPVMLSSHQRLLWEFWQEKERPKERSTRQQDQSDQPNISKGVPDVDQELDSL
jgi:hypothetical protein